MSSRSAHTSARVRGERLCWLKPLAAGRYSGREFSDSLLHQRYWDLLEMCVQCSHLILATIRR